MKLLFAAGKVIVLTAIVLGASGQSFAQLAITDGDFTDWTFSSRADPGTSASVVREATDGNPGARLNITTSTGVGGSTAFGTAIKNDFTTNEPLNGRSFTLTLDVLSGPGARLAGQGIELLIEQNGTVYAVQVGVTGFPRNFDPVSFSGTIDCALFTRVIGTGPLQPVLDGSVTTRFGFGAGNTGSGNVTQFYDNFQLAIGAPAFTPTTRTITSSPNPSDQGETVEFTATVSGACGVPGGTVTFFNGGTSLGTAPLSAGVATFMTAGLPAGTNSITASYGGDAVFAAGTSAPLLQVVIAAAVGVADLVLTKTASVAIIQPSGQFAYTLTVRNNGPAGATGVVITDTLPSGVTFVSSAGCTQASGVVTCNVGALANGASAVRTVLVRAPSTAGAFANRATATADQSDPTAANNASAVTVSAQDIAPIPTVGEWGLIFLALLLATTALWNMRRRNRNEPV